MTPREKRHALFEDLVRLEKEGRAGSSEDADYSSRRDAVIAQLVALDASLDGPEEAADEEPYRANR